MGYILKVVPHGLTGMNKSNFLAADVIQNREYHPSQQATSILDRLFQPLDTLVNDIMFEADVHAQLKSFPEYYQIRVRGKSRAQSMILIDSSKIWVITSRGTPETYTYETTIECMNIVSSILNNICGIHEEPDENDIIGMLTEIFG